MLNALVSFNFFDAAHSVSGRGQAHIVNIPAGETREAQAGTGLFGVRPLCGGLDNTRSYGAPCSHAGLAG